MAETVFTDEMRLRDFYPDLPGRTSTLFMKLDRGDWNAADELRNLVGELEIDPWHQTVIDQVVGTHHKVTDREAVLCGAIAAMEVIKSQIVAGQPYIERNGWQGHHGFSAGILGDPSEIVEFTKYPGLTLKTTSTYVSRPHLAVFPSFQIGRGLETDIRIFGDCDLNQSAWDHLGAIANGSGFVAFGHENVLKNTAVLGDEQKFHAALALKGAGIDIDLGLNPELAEEAMKYATKDLAVAAAGLDLTAKEKKMSNVCGSSKDMRLLFDVIGAHEKQVGDMARDWLQDLIGKESTIVTEVARALSGLGIVEKLTSVVFAEN